MKERPNILLISTDQQSASAMSCAGNGDLSTPSMDRLAAGGLRFSRAYCTHPLCAPARSSYVTGRMPHDTGVTSNHDPLREALHGQTLGRLLGDAGYRCALAGKWHVPGITPRESGLEVLCGARDDEIPEASAGFLRSGEGPFFLFASFLNPHDVCQLARSQPLPQGPVPEPASLAECPNLPANFEEPPYGPEILRFVQAHTPRVYAAAGFTAEEWRRFRHQYFRIVEKVDAEVGRLLDAVRDAGRWEDTLILLTSDHGDGHGAHRWNGKTALWEEVIRIPLLACGPGVRGPGRVEERLVSNGLDLLPTICEAAGAAAPADLPGRSLRPLLAGEPPGDWRQDLVVETITGIGDGPGGPALARALVGERYKYSVYALGRGREQLVDLPSDPGEMVNLAVEARFGGELAACRERLRSLCQASGDDVGRLIP